MKMNTPTAGRAPSWSPRLCFVGFALLLTGPLRAQVTYYWDGNGTTAGAGTQAGLGGTWGSSAFWNTVADGTGATTAASITSADTVVFGAYDAATPANNPTGGYTVTLNGAQSVNGLVIGSASATGGGGTPTLSGTGSPGLTIGAGGVTLAGSNGDPTFNANLGTITLAADQTWTVNNGHVWSVNTGIAGNATTGDTRVWTLGFVGAYTNAYSGILSDGAGGGQLAVTVNNSGGGIQSFTGTASTYTGKTTIQRGTVQVKSIGAAGASGSLGAATGANSIIDLGSGTNSANLYLNGSSAASTSDRVVNLAGTTGGGTIKNNNSNAGYTLTLGGVTNAGGGNKTLTLAGSNTGDNTMGAITNAGDASTTTVVKTEAGKWVLNGDNTFTGGLVVNNGTLVVSGAANHFDGAIAVSGSSTLLTLNGATDFSKGLTVSSGTVIIGAAGALGQDVGTNNIVVSGGNLQFNADSAFTNSNRAITINSGGIGIGAGGVLPTYIDNTANGVVLGLNLVGSAGITGLTGKSFLGTFTGGTFTGASLTAGDNATYRLGGGGGSLIIQNSVLVGANNLLVGSTGGGTVTLAGANTYSGTTTVQNGVLSVASINSVSGGSGSSSLGAAPANATVGTITLGSGTNAVSLNYTGGGGLDRRHRRPERIQSYIDQQTRRDQQHMDAFRHHRHGREQHLHRLDDDLRWCAFRLRLGLRPSRQFLPQPERLDRSARDLAGQRHLRQDALRHPKRCEFRVERVWWVCRQGRHAHGDGQ